MQDATNFKMHIYKFFVQTTHYNQTVFCKDSPWWKNKCS